VVKRAMEEGAKRIPPNGMGHSFASNLLTAGVSDMMISRWLGHDDTTMVYRHYGHLLQYRGDINRVRIGPLVPA
jgi:integrase